MSDCLIWSFEHNGWWAPAMSGYVGAAEHAGRYKLEVAESICRKANIAAIDEAIVPLSEYGIPASQPSGTRGGLR